MAPQVPAAGCNRACLADVLNRYLSSLVAHDPGIAPLADSVRYTANAMQMPVGEGFWKTASKVLPYRNDFLDVRGGTAAVQAVMEEGDKPVLFAARLRVVDRHIAEIETMVVRSAKESLLFAPQSLSKPSPVMMKRPPKDQLMPRDQMVQVALRYPAGLRAGSFVTADVPFAPGAYRLENGVKMAGPGCTFQPPGCENIRTQQIPKLPEVKQRVVAVDEEDGTVLLWLDFGKGSLPGGQYAGKKLVTFEAFKVYGGQIHGVEAVFTAMPEDAASGW